MHDKTKKRHSGISAGVIQKVHEKIIKRIKKKAEFFLSLSDGLVQIMLKVYFDLDQSISIALDFPLCV